MPSALTSLPPHPSKPLISNLFVCKGPQEIHLPWSPEHLDSCGGHHAPASGTGSSCVQAKDIPLGVRPSPRPHLQSQWDWREVEIRFKREEDPLLCLHPHLLPQVESPGLCHYVPFDEKNVALDMLLSSLRLGKGLRAISSSRRFLTPTPTHLWLPDFPPWPAAFLSALLQQLAFLSISPDSKVLLDTGLQESWWLFVASRLALSRCTIVGWANKLWEPTELWPPDCTDKAVSAEPGRPSLTCLKTGGAVEEGEEENR